MDRVSLVNPDLAHAG